MLKESILFDKSTEDIFKNTGTSPTNNKTFRQEWISCG